MSHGGKSIFLMTRWGDSKNSHRKVTFEMSENQEMSENPGLYDEIDIFWYQS